MTFLRCSWDGDNVVVHVGNEEEKLSRDDMLNFVLQLIVDSAREEMDTIKAFSRELRRITKQLSEGSSPLLHALRKSTILVRPKRDATAMVKSMFVESRHRMKQTSSRLQETRAHATALEQRAARLLSGE